MTKLNASFRDPEGYIFTSSQGEILRQINPIGDAEFDLLNSSGLYEELIKKISFHIVNTIYVYLSTHPTFKSKILKLLKAIGLYNFARKINFRISGQAHLKETKTTLIIPNQPSTSDKLSKQAQACYKELNDAFDKNKDEK